MDTPGDFNIMDIPSILSMMTVIAFFYFGRRKWMGFTEDIDMMINRCRKASAMALCGGFGIGFIFAALAFLYL